MTRRQLVVQGGALAAGALAFAGCGGAGASTGQDLRVSFSDAEVDDKLDPAVAQSTFAVTFCGHVYDTLVVADTSWKVHPSLAERWRARDDGATWEFELREGVKFHDGRPMTAADAAYTIRRLLDEETGSGIYGRLVDNLDPDGVVAVDARRLRIRLKRPDAFLPLALTVRYAAIVPDGTESFRDGTGTGPFRATQFRPGEYAELDRNPSYWRRGVPHLRSIRGRVIAEPSTKIQSVIAGDAHLCDAINPADLPMAESPRTRLIAAEDALFLTVALDAEKSPFDDNRVRMAIKLATDRERILEVALRGRGSIAADTPVPRSDPLFPPGLERRRDVERARQLLADAGHADGLTLTLYSADVGVGMMDFAVVFAESQKDAGIDVEVVKRPAATYFDQVWLKEPMFADYWGRRHPSEMLPLVFTRQATQREGNFRDPRVDRLTAVAQRATAPRARRAAYHEALRIVAEQSGLVIPVYGDRLWVSKGVSGAALNIYGALDATGARLA